MQTLLTKIKSSNIESIGYDPAAKILYIKFLSGGLYSYSPVKQSTYDRFKKAKSKGKHFHKHIKDNSKYEVKRIV